MKQRIILLSLLLAQSSLAAGFEGQWERIQGDCESEIELAFGPNESSPAAQDLRFSVREAGGGFRLWSIYERLNEAPKLKKVGPRGFGLARCYYEKTTYAAQAIERGHLNVPCLAPLPLGRFKTESTFTLNADGSELTLKRGRDTVCAYQRARL